MIKQTNMNISFDENNFIRFKNSTNFDGNYVGIYNNEKILRVITNKINDIKTIVDQVRDFPFLIDSKIFIDTDHKLIIEHPQLKNITYYIEWTKKQRVEAAEAIIQLQTKLSSRGYYLNDPHAFNITFEYSCPIYFDFGSITKGKIIPAWWFLKCFTGWRENDYWDDVLHITRIAKLWIALRLIASRKPYNYLRNRIRKYESNLIEKVLYLLINKSVLFSKLIARASLKFPSLLTRFTNWTTYDQSTISENSNTERDINLINIFRKNSTDSFIDIGANKGAYSILALRTGFKEAVSIDLDQASVDFIRNYANEKGLRIWTGVINLMNYNETPGCYSSYLPAHERLNCDFGFCLAVVHHVCYFGNSSFDEFAERVNRFVNKSLIVEFVPYDDIHLTGPMYKGKDRSWYTRENFIKSFQKYFPGEVEIYNSTPMPRILVKFTK